MENVPLFKTPTNGSKREHPQPSGGIPNSHAQTFERRNRADSDNIQNPERKIVAMNFDPSAHVHKPLQSNPTTPRQGAVNPKV